MKLPKKFRMIVVSAAMALSVAGVHAQDQSKDPRSISPIPPNSSTNAGANSGFGKSPIPAAHGVSALYDAQLYDPALAEPDTNTLSGTEVFGVGSLQHPRDLFDPSITVSSLGQSGATDATGQTALHAITLVGGSLNFNHIWSRYHFTTTYNGGENPVFEVSKNTMYYNLGGSQDIVLQRFRPHPRV